MLIQTTIYKKLDDVNLMDIGTDIFVTMFRDKGGVI